MIIYYGNLQSVKGVEAFPGEIALLESFAYKKKVNPPQWASAYFLDSGAFTAWRKGTPIILEDYIRFLKEQDLSGVTVYAALDDIESHEKSFFNYCGMKEAGLDPLPVYHEGEPFSVLEYYAARHSYVGLGGIAMSGGETRKRWLDRIFTAFPDPGQVGFHGFGVMEEELILRYPWKSVDATSIHMQARYGGFYFPKRGWLKINPNVNPKELRWKTELTERKIADYIESLGYSYADAIKQDATGILTRCFLSLSFFESLRPRVPEKYTGRNIKAGFFECI